MPILIINLQILNHLHYEKFAYFIIKKEEIVKLKFKNIESKSL